MTARLFVPNGVEDQRPKDEYRRTRMGFVRDVAVQKADVELVPFDEDDK